MYFGAICNFASVFLLARGYANAEIGVTLAVSNMLAVVLQPLIADLADRAKRISLIGISEIITVMMMAATAGLLAINGKTMALTVIFVLLIAWHMVLQPLFNSLAFRLSEAGAAVHFGLARSMGSLIYAVFTAVFGVIVERFGVLSIPITGEVVLVMLLISLMLAKHSFQKARRAAGREDGRIRRADGMVQEKADGGGVSRAGGPRRAEADHGVVQEGAGGSVSSDGGVPRDGGSRTIGTDGDASRNSGAGKTGADHGVVQERVGGGASGNGDALRNGKPQISLLQFAGRHRWFFLVNLGVLGLYFGNAVFNNYMAQIVDSVGGGSEDMGLVFGISALCEIPFMAGIHLLRKKFSCQSMLKAASIGFLLKTGACALASSVHMVIAAHLFQLAGFGLFLPAMVLFIDETMDRMEAVKGQALFTTMTAAATVFSSLAGGVILDASGAKALLVMATAVTAAGAAILIATVDRVQKRQD